MDNARQQLHETNLLKKIYTTNHIRFGTFLGGPLVAGYFFAENYNAFGDSGRARAAWIYAIAASIVIYGGIIALPQTVKIPGVVFPIAYCWIAYYLAEHFQGAQINAHNITGGKFFGWGRVNVIGLIGVAITFAGVFIGAVATGD